MKKLETALKSLNVTFSDQQLEMLEKYMNEVLIKNRNINLTAIKDRQEFIVKHYIDSLLAACTPEFLQAETVIDVGTGGGFPGVPLAVFFPEKKFILLDSLAKRLKTVQEIANRIGITNLGTVHGRAEGIAKDVAYREQFDICVSRAVAPLATLAEYCIPFVKVGGNFIAYKTVKATEEIDVAKKAVMLMGGMVEREVKEFGIATKMQHTLVIINKNRKTPIKYPRKAGTPARKPILNKNVPRETSKQKP